MASLYYSPPPEEIFKEVKEAAKVVWGKYDDSHGYATEKIKRIEGLANVGDNLMYIVGMMDIQNQAELGLYISGEAREAIHLRFKAGGGDDSGLPAIFKLYRKW